VSLCTANNSFAQSSKLYSQVSSDPKITAALNMMDGTSADWAKDAILGNNVSGMPIKVRFRNLAEISPKYADFDALGWKTGKQLNIYINQKHRSAPAEAVASLLSHESVHQDEYCSLEEETYAWGYEGDVWLQMEKKHQSLRNIAAGTYPLVDRLNTIARLLETSNYTTAKVRDVVYSNPGYSGLPVHSPGF
jgi:hypothetical protein